MGITNLWRAQQPFILYLAAGYNGEFCHNFISASDKACQHNPALDSIQSVSEWSTLIGPDL